jgi:hypothetical protein
VFILSRDSVVVQLLAFFSIFHIAKVAKHIWDLVLPAENGSTFPNFQIFGATFRTPRISEILDSECESDGKRQKS